MDLVGARIAVLGGAGFIGLHVSRELVARGAKIRIVDLCKHPGSQEAAMAIADLCGDDVSARDRYWLSYKTDMVINLATVNVREAVVNPVSAARAINEIGCVVAHACLDAEVRRYVYVSSSEIYGDAYNGPLGESSLPMPKTTYGVAKLAGEHYTRCVRGSVETIVIRPFNAYGPGCHLHGNAAELIPRLILHHASGEPVTVFGAGTQTRDFTHVRDIARGIVDAAACDAFVNTGPVNLASGIERSINEIVSDVVPKAAVQHGPDRPGDLQRQVGNASRAATILGWSPTIDWEDGIQETIEDVLRRAQ